MTGRSGYLRCARRFGITLGSFTLLLVPLLAGCGGDENASDVLAEVNGSPITTEHLANALRAQGGATDERNAAGRILEALIDEQLLYERALDNELERDPAVAQQIEQARRRILVRAYAERMIFPTAPIGIAEQMDYYRSNPELFAKRRVYQVISYTLYRPDLTGKIHSQLSRARTADEVREILARHAIEHEAQALTRAAEQLPLEELSRFARARSGDLLIMQPRDGRRIMMLVTAVQESPISADQALPIIRQFLVNERNSRALAEYLRDARRSARVTYSAGARRLVLAQAARIGLPSRANSSPADRLRSPTRGAHSESPVKPP